MKKRGKGLLAFWLVFMLTVVSVPETIQAGSSLSKSADRITITHQPTTKEPYVKLNKEGASFAWHKAESARFQVVSEKKQDNQIEAASNGNSYNTTLEGWEASNGLLDIEFPAKKGDLITVTPCNGFSGTAKDTSGNLLTDQGDGTYTMEITAEGTFSFSVSETQSRSFWAKVEITRLAPADKVSGQNSDTFTGAPGTYICVATLSDGSSVTSDPIEVLGYDITTSSAGNGNCRIEVQGTEVTSAALGQKVTIKPEPANSYELDTVTVTKKDNSSTQITVTDNSFIMPDYPVLVHVTFRRPSYHITLPAGTGYTAKAQQSGTAEYGSNYIFTITLEDNYEASEDFSVTSNDTVLTPTGKDGSTYTYTLYNIIENQTIKVTGIKLKDLADTKDENPPEIAINLNEDNVWKDFMHMISFGTFFKENKKLTISVKDSESGVREGSIKYYLANQDLFRENKVYTAQEIEQKIPSWTEYKEAVVLPDNKTYVLYAKAEDNSGNVSYASTTGIIIDTIAPSIAQMESGKTYYGNSTFTVKDDYLETVVVDGKTIKVSGSTHTLTIPADNSLHTISAADRAGNTVSCNFYVNETWLRDGISMSGLYPLEPDNSYKLCKGKWKVAGDSTIYEGNCTVYVDESSNFDFQKQ